MSSGNDGLFPRGSEFGPNSEIPASPGVLTRPRPGNAKNSTHTHTYIYIYVYTYICIYIYDALDNRYGFSISVQPEIDCTTFHSFFS